MEMKQPNSTYPEDRSLETQFASLIKNILGQIFIRREEVADLEQGTDFAIFEVNPFRVAVRLRRFDYFLAFHKEFTIRWSRPSGVKTEIHKIREGLVDYLFYGFLSSDETEIIQHFVADLTKFGTPMPYKIYQNDPPDSELAVFKLNQFSANFLVAFYCQPNYKFAWANH